MNDIRTCDSTRGVVFKMLLLLVVFTQAEARVFCQDSHARPWEPLGYACPVNCANIKTAARKLRALDYGHLFSYHDLDMGGQPQRPTNTQSQNRYHKNITAYHEVVNENIRRTTDPETNIKMYERYYKILNNKKVARDLKNEYKTAEASLKACYSQNEVNFKLTNKLNVICTRRSFIETDFLKKFTSILNKYTNTVPFTEELTAMILEKILGKNLDLRHGIFDVDKILVFLSTAIRSHAASETQNGQVIHLKSKHCLYLSVPGCFCMAGFVEKSGQCVMPSDCFEGPIETTILSRIIVH